MIKWPWVSRKRFEKVWLDHTSEMLHRVQNLEAERSAPWRARVSDVDLAGLLNVPPENPVLRGVMEVLARAEERSVEYYCANGGTVEFRAEGGVAVRAIRGVKEDILSAVEMARGKRK